MRVWKQRGGPILYFTRSLSLCCLPWCQSVFFKSFFLLMLCCVSKTTDRSIDRIRIRSFQKNIENRTSRDFFSIYTRNCVWNRGKLHEFATETNPLLTRTKHRRGKEEEDTRARTRTLIGKEREREIVLVHGLQIRSDIIYILEKKFKTERRLR